MNSDKYISDDHMDGTADPAEGYDTYKLAKEEIGEANPDKGKLKRFVEQGSMLTYQNCLSTVEGIAINSHQMSYTKDQYLIGSVLATGLLAINGASTESVERLALGSSFLVSSLELYQNYYLMGPDAASVVDLVRNAMDTQLDYTLEQRPKTFYEAAKLILDLSYVCSSVQINQMVADSIRTANIKPPSQVVPQVLVQEQLENVLDINILSNHQLAAIYELMTVGEAGLEDGKWTASALDTIEDKVLSNFSEIRKLLALQPQSFRNGIEEYISRIKSKTDSHTPPAADIQKQLDDLMQSLSKYIGSSAGVGELQLTFLVFRVLDENNISLAEFEDDKVEPYEKLSEEEVDFLKSNATAMEAWYRSLNSEERTFLTEWLKQDRSLAEFLSLETRSLETLSPAVFDYKPVRTGRSIVTIERE